MLLALLACTDPPDDRGAPDDTAADTGTDTGADTGPAPSWDPGAALVDCAEGEAAPLLERALTDAGLDRAAFGVSDQDWNTWRTYVDDPFNLSWYPEVHHAPERVPCFGAQLTADLDAAAAAAHPVAAMLGAYAPYVDVTLTDTPIDARDTTLEAALAQLASATGSADDPARASELDPTLADALTPVVVALAQVVERRAALDALDNGDVNNNRLHSSGAGWVLGAARPVPNLADDAETEGFTSWYLDPAGPRSALTAAARQVAFAVEDADLGRFAGQDHTWRWSTAAGDLLISGSGDDTHDAKAGALLFHLELGGDDAYLDGAGATADEDNPASVLVDLGGDDRYGYVEVTDPNDGPGLLPSDADGRQSASGYYVSASSTGRQGSGRYGVGMLFDRGGGQDRYISLRMSQGFGSMGVGVLADDGGDDTYAGEAAVQGSGVWGVGILLDGGGNDVYTAWAYAQGFAYVGSGGVLYDVDGADVYWADPGRDAGGTTLYYSPQLASGQGNSSLSQGAGFGLRGDSYGRWFSGGLGVLRDGAGDDDYTGGVFAQSTGYWQGTGVLADGAGNDEYDALWYIQAGAAHFALALFLESGGDDLYNPDVTPYNVALGSGHDFSVGVFVDESGSDTYHSTTLAMGASNCQGIGVFADNAGSDTYQAVSTYGYGLGNHSGECTSRTAYPSIGLFLDAGGDADTYTWPDPEGRQPADDTDFGIAWTGSPTEFGGASDGDGETNFHAR